MREIKFRAKRVYNNQWVYGYYFIDLENKLPYIMLAEQIHTPEEWVFKSIQVVPETVSQFTGLHDKNGKPIFEGDILRVPPQDEWDKTNYSCFEVFFHDGDANLDYNIGFTMSRMHNHGSVCGGYIPSFKPKTVSKMEVIGNIYENPDLCPKS